LDINDFAPPVRPGITSKFTIKARDQKYASAMCSAGFPGQEGQQPAEVETLPLVQNVNDHFSRA